MLSFLLFFCSPVVRGSQLDCHVDKGVTTLQKYQKSIQEAKEHKISQDQKITEAGVRMIKLQTSSEDLRSDLAKQDTQQKIYEHSIFQLKTSLERTVSYHEAGRRRMHDSLYAKKPIFQVKNTTATTICISRKKNKVCF